MSMSLIKRYIIIIRVWKICTPYIATILIYCCSWFEPALKKTPGSDLDSVFTAAIAPARFKWSPSLPPLKRHLSHPSRISTNWYPPFTLQSLRRLITLSAREGWCYIRRLKWPRPDLLLGVPPRRSAWRQLSIARCRSIADDIVGAHVKYHSLGPGLLYCSRQVIFQML